VNSALNKYLTDYERVCLFTGFAAQNFSSDIG